VSQGAEDGIPRLREDRQEGKLTNGLPITEESAPKRKDYFFLLYESELGGVLPGDQEIDLLAHPLAREQLERGLWEWSTRRHWLAGRHSSGRTGHSLHDA